MGTEHWASERVGRVGGKGIAARGGIRGPLLMHRQLQVLEGSPGVRAAQPNRPGMAAAGAWGPAAGSFAWRFPSGAF